MTKTEYSTDTRAGRPMRLARCLRVYPRRIGLAAGAGLALLAAAYVFGKREHMRMGFIVDRLGATKRFFFDLLREVLVFLFSLVVMIIGGIAIMRLTMTQVTASLGIPMGVVYAAVPLSGVLSLIYSILNILALRRK